jgi:hypothetical protein
MPGPNSNYSEALVASIDLYRKKLADNVLDNNVTLLYIKNNGGADPASGGVKLLENLMYAENGTFQWYSGAETLSVEASDVLTNAQFEWKQANCNVVMTGLEEAQNDGPSRMHSLITARIRVAEATMQNQIGASIFYSNTENGGKSIGGLQHLVADLPTSGTVGGIARDSSSNAWWRNQYYDFLTETVTASATTIQHAMNLIWMRTERGTEHVDLVVAGETYFSYYEESLQAQQRFMDTSKAVGGFNGYKYKSATVFYDPNCASTRMYMLNTKFMHFRPYRERNFVVLKDKVAVNQDATVTPLYWMGNLTMSNAARQGVICA